MKLNKYGFPSEVLDKSGQFVYLGLDWPSDCYDFLTERLRSYHFRLFKVDDDVAIDAGDAVGFADACIWVADNAANASLLRCDNLIDMFITDDNDFYAIAAPLDFLLDLSRYVREKYGITDTERVMDPDFGLNSTLESYFNAYRSYNVELRHNI